MMKKRRNHKRAEGKTSLTASVPKSLKQALVSLAKEENRSLSNFLVVELEPLVRNKLAALAAKRDQKKDRAPQLESSPGLPASLRARRSSFPPTATGLNEPEGDYPARKDKPK